MFNPVRLTLARQRRGFTKKALALALGVDQKTVIRYEGGEAVPPSVVAIATCLSFPEAFFLGADIDQPLADQVSFRSLRSMPARDRDAALASGAFAYLIDDWVVDRFELPATDVPDLKGAADAEGAAIAVRRTWGLGEKPIRNVVHLLEAHGVRVFSLRDHADAVDAFSTWRVNIPYVFLNAGKTAERSRFDAAHELGHLVLHRHGGAPGGGREVEDEANRFASAFLMPRSDVLARLPRVSTLNQIIEGKRRWGVSVAALNYRLHQLGITSDWQYRIFCIQINERFGRSEPASLPRETSLVWTKIFEQLRGEGVGKLAIARDLALPVAEVEDLLFRLTNMQSIEGGLSSPASSKGRARLSLVFAAETSPNDDHLERVAD
jgi:Zn-dependent peptidase ImmA (M78 family)/DNA-binding XRE family transcriptional regulator